MEQLKPIQEHLNRLCSQHDELMTLLEVYEYVPSLKQWQQINKQICTKINAYELQIQQLEENHSRVKIREEIHERSKREETQIAIESVQLKITKMKEEITKQHQKLIELQGNSHSERKQLLHTSTKIKKEIDRAVELSYQQLSNSVAKLKTDLQLNISKTKKDRSNKKLHRAKLSQLTNQCLSQQQYSYDRLMHQIQQTKLELPQPEYLSFFQYTYTSIRQEIEQEMEHIKLYNQVKKQIADKGQDYDQKEIIKIFERTYENLVYRIKGMKRYAGMELMMRYAEQQNKYEVNQLEKKIQNNIKYLQNSIKTLQQTIHQLTN